MPKSILPWQKLLPQKQCPHESCGKNFFAPLVLKGILFCPHCQNSLLFAKKGDYSHLFQRTPNLTFWQFLNVYLKDNYRFLMVLTVTIVLVGLYATYPNHMIFQTIRDNTTFVKISLDMLFWLMIAGVTLLLFWVIFRDIKSKTGYQDYVKGFFLKNKPLTAGADTVTGVQQDDIRYAFLYSSGQISNQNNTTQQVTCPQCSSQQLVNYHWLANHASGNLYRINAKILAQVSQAEAESNTRLYVCQKCSKVTYLNARLNTLTNRQQIIQFIMNFSFYGIMVFGTQKSINPIILIVGFIGGSLMMLVYFSYQKSKLPLWNSQ